MFGEHNDFEHWFTWHDLLLPTVQNIFENSEKYLHHFPKNFNLICCPYNNTPCLLQVTARSRNQISLWFQDLSGNKPLTVLAKKVSGPNNSDV